MAEDRLSRLLRDVDASRGEVGTYEAIRYEFEKLEETIRASGKATVQLLIDAAESKKRVADLEGGIRRAGKISESLHYTPPEAIGERIQTLTETLRHALWDRCKECGKWMSQEEAKGHADRCDAPNNEETFDAQEGSGPDAER